mgnify:CR=1 FL=1
MRISDVEKKTKLPISTIRYYEKVGMIPDEYVQRDHNNYRNYRPDIILQVVKNCLAVGFSIHDVKAMISKNKLTKAEQTRILKEKIAEIDVTQAKLAASRQALVDIIDSDVVCECGFGKYK